MRKTAFTGEQVAYPLRAVEAGASVAETGRQLRVSQHGLPPETEVRAHEVAELRRLRVLENENRKLQQLVADQTSDKHVLREVISRKL
jgi:putative transposase